ncbi:hypothetical protein ACIRRH_24250 [Kitasatospora sp. NPDC101235]|uniref:hypothetical protein n=1 Tax=Kitasatospora sp. NPDC101235 TaxID=3364101 RepID=UPI0037FCE9B7
MTTRPSAERASRGRWPARRVRLAAEEGGLLRAVGKDGCRELVVVEFVEGTADAVDGFEQGL